jgi:hypothetical protein
VTTVSFLICFSETYEGPLESLVRWVDSVNDKVQVGQVFRICVKAYLVIGKLDCNQTVFQGLLVDLVEAVALNSDDEAVLQVARLFRQIEVGLIGLREIAEQRALANEVFSSIMERLAEWEASDTIKRDDEASKIVPTGTTVEKEEEEELKEDSLDEVSFEGSPHSFIEDAPLLMRGNRLPPADH